MTQTHDGTHASHCCPVHGCKYGEPDCPVVSGRITAMYKCHECEGGCKHPKITTFVLADTGEPAGLWACAACGKKFVPLDLEMERDAARYRWIKSRNGLTLRSEPANSVWKRGDGTMFTATHQLVEGGMQHATAESLDAMIDVVLFSERKENNES